MRGLPDPPRPDAAAIVDWIDDVVTITARNNAEIATKQTRGQVYSLGVYTVANLPAAAANQGGVLAVSDEAGGFTLAFSDGTNWRRVQDRAIVS